VSEWASSTTATATPGSCRNDADTGDITLASQATADVTIGHSGVDGLPVAGGLDEIGLDNLLVSPITCSQNFTLITCSASILPALGERAITGTVTTSGITLLGTGTKFLTELSVGDIIGNATGGWSQITAIASDTSLTTLFALTAFAGLSCTMAENPTIQPNNAARDQIQGIQPVGTPGTNIIVATSVSHGAGSPLAVGVAAPSVWLAVWLIDDGATPALFLSTQGQTLLSPPAGYTSFRRIGWIYNEVDGGQLREIFYEDAGIKRHAVYEMASQPVQVTTTNSNGVWTPVPFNAVAPRTARRLELRVVGDNSAGAGQSRTFFRARNFGDATVNRGRRLGMGAGEAQDQDTLIVPCDDVQVSEYGMDNADMLISIQLIGYMDVL
jgi:hypothetical protein